MSQHDYQMALLLQQQFEHEANIESPKNNLVYTPKKNKKNYSATKCLTDPSWELIDPTPNIHILYMAFNEKYFWSKLETVCVAWSKRMTTCAGICAYQGRGGMCRITLSEPLLKLRPRKDLIETLLHEMIHAYLFVTHNNRDRDGHGPEFHKHMHRINAEAGTNITVYHDFHDEVRLYQQHWWRCNGPCQTRKPYFGMVRRATNRAPGPYDRWWADHQQSCSGTFIKVKEPEKPQKKNQKSNKAVVSPKNDIRNFFPTLNGSTAGSSTSVNKVTGFKDLNATKPRNALANSSSTIVINKKPTAKTKQTTEEEPTSNVQPKPPSINIFNGEGHVLGNRKPNDNGDYAQVRNHWLNKFATTNKRSFSDSSVPENGKKPKPNSTATSDELNRGTKNAVVDLTSSSDGEGVSCPICSKRFPEDKINAHLDNCLEQHESGPSESSKPSDCPVCDQRISVDTFDNHLKACLSEVMSDDAFENSETVQELIPCLVCNKQIPKGDLNEHLDECMGDNIFSSDDANNDGVSDVTDGFKVEASEEDDKAEKKYNCPVCFQQVSISKMSDHLDICLVNNDESSKSDGKLGSYVNEEVVKHLFF